MVGPMGWFRDEYPKISREEYLALRGPMDPDTIRVYEQGGDERLVPLPQRLLRDPLVEAHLEDAGVGRDEYGYAARFRAASASEPLGVELFGLRPGRRAPGQSMLLTDVEEFGNGRTGWDPEKPLVVRCSDRAKAWVLLGTRRWELRSTAGSLEQALDEWVEEPGPGSEIGGGKA